ncbi:hypothetical protein Tco_0653347 [Tanacetum coccineum]|uniref:Uncharacterized protein n=1 Tax=Tanacetum coccineum TaxID=301880 RepID=A0ABQ4X0F0_9ASTR
MVTTRRNSDDDDPNFEAMSGWLGSSANALPTNGCLRTQRTPMTSGIVRMGPICQLDRENSGYHGECSLDWLVAAAARNIELLHESGNSNKRDRDGNRIQNRGQGQQENKGRYDQGQHEYRGRQDRGYDSRRQDFRGQDQRVMLQVLQVRRGLLRLCLLYLFVLPVKPQPVKLFYKLLGDALLAGLLNIGEGIVPKREAKQNMPTYFARLPPPIGLGLCYDSVKHISAMNSLLDSHGCQGFCILLWTHLWRDLILKNLSVFLEFADVFPDEHPGLPPARECDLA